MSGYDAIAGPIGSRFDDIRWMTSTGSTNADALALARDGAGEGLVLVADHQTAGRGRAGRTWNAPPGASLLCTVLLRPPAAVASLVTMALAVAASEAIEKLAGFAPELKWPNDLVVGKRKLAGVLAEAEWPPGANIAGGWKEPAPHERATVAAGIGINVNWPDEVPEELDGIAVSINHVSGKVVDRRRLLGELLERLEGHYAALVTGDRSALLDEWRERSATLGADVRIDLGSTEVEGRAVDIADDGRLIVETGDGERRTFAVGDVVHLRAR